MEIDEDEFKEYLMGELYVNKMMIFSLFKPEDFESKKKVSALTEQQMQDIAENAFEFMIEDSYKESLFRAVENKINES